MKFLVGLFALALAACGTDVNTGPGPGSGDPPPGMGTGDPLEGLPTGLDQWTALCAKHYGDAISAKFCANATPPTLTSLVDLETLLGLRVYPNPNNDPTINANVRLTLNAESEGLGMRQVNSLAPRAFIMTNAGVAGGAALPSYQVLSFSRGEAFVEMVANDKAANTLRFFLVRFHPACEPNCNFADLTTPTIESGWTDYTIYDDDTIKNTTVDCLSCHQPGGPTTKRILRMQELANPWAHWFYPERPETLQLVQEFMAAHGSEDYAGIPMSQVMPSRPAALMNLVMNNGFAAQPNIYNTLQIRNELAASGSSATWASLYASSVAGMAIPTSYFANPGDPAKVSAATAAYQQTMAGTLPRDQMPDIRDTMLDAALPEMSVRPAAGLDGRGILVHMCRMCHNSSLDQTLTRSQFNIDTLDQLPRAEKDLAIQRLMMDDSDRHRMPPSRFHTLSDPERDLVIQELMK
jgi:hypothetical protein